MTKEPRDFWWMPFLKTGQKFSCNFHFGVSTGIIISVWQWAISRSGSQVEWVLSSTIAQAIKQCRGGFVTTSSHWCWGLRCHVCWHLWNGMLVWNHLASQAETGSVHLEGLRECVSHHTFLDLPTVEMTSQTKFVKCFLDVALNVERPIPKTDVKEHLMSQSPLADLPPPCVSRKDLGQSQRCRIDLAVVKQTDEKFCVVKILNFKDKIKTAEAGYGKPYMFDWIGPRRKKHTTQYLLPIIYIHIHMHAHIEPDIYTYFHIYGYI